MKVKINGKIYDAEKDAILLHLNQNDKLNIANMAEDASIYACFPTTTSSKESRLSAVLTFKKEINS